MSSLYQKLIRRRFRRRIAAEKVIGRTANHAFSITSRNIKIPAE